MQPVDRALILAIDGSASVGFDEFASIAGGMAAALRDRAVVAGLLAGPARATAAAVLLFSGAAAQDLVVDWTRIASTDAAAAFADRVENMPRVLRPGLTAIGNALLAAEALFAGLSGAGGRRIVDVAGDGRANDGIPPAAARDRLVAAGITINGLCVLHEEPDLVATFTAEVIGGEGAFAQPCPDYPGFAAAMRRKLLREITDKPIA